MSERTRKLIYCAVFIAIATSLSLLSGFFTIFKISLAPMVVMFAGATLGPLLGGITGAVTDIVKFAILPTGPYFPGFMVTMALYGVLSGLIFYQNKKRQTTPIIVLGTVLIQTICSALINTFWLHTLMGTPYTALLLSRLPVTYISCAVYAILLAILIPNKKRIVRTALPAGGK